MGTTNPIRGKRELEKFKNYYLEKEKYRNYLLIIMGLNTACLLYTSPSPRDPELSRMPSSA